MKNIFSNIKNILTILIVFLAFSSCQKNRLDTSWDVDLGLPILHSRLDVGDIFGDTLLLYNPDNSVSLIVDYGLSTGLLDSLLNVKDTLSNYVFTLPFIDSVKLAPKVNFISSNDKSVLDFGSVNLSKATTKNTRIKVLITNTLKQPLQLTYSIFSATQNGTYYEIKKIIPASTSAGTTKDSLIIKLDDYNLNLTGLTGNELNTLYIGTVCCVQENADTAYFTKKDTVSAVTIIDNLDLAYVQGYFGQKSFSLVDTGAMSFFGNFSSGNFDINKVNGYLLIENKMGIDASMTINYLKAVNTETSEVVPLNHSLFGTKLNLNRAGKTGNPLSPVISYQKKFDLNNSDIDKMFEIKPNALAFSLDFMSNPMGNMSGGNDFFYNGYGLDAKIHLDIPLNISLENLLIESNSPIHFDDNNKALGGFLTLRAKNFFPFDLALQFYLLDENGNIADSLITDNKIVGSGIIDAGGYVIQEKNTDLRIDLTPTMLKNLRKYKKMRIKAKVSTYDLKKYQIYQHYYLDVKLIGNLEYEI